MLNHQPEPRLYEIRVHGHLDQCWSDWFGGLALTHHPDGSTTLRGHVTDQPHLHGLLVKVRDLGATLISVNLLTGTDGQLTTPSTARAPHGSHT